MPHVRFRASAIVSVLVALGGLVSGCSSKEQGKPGGQEDASHAPTAPVASVAAPVDAAPPPPPEPPKVPKKYAKVLHTGDSMVGGGLAWTLGPMFKADGTVYVRDVIESGTIHEFAQSDHLPKLLASVKPDLVVLSLGANHVPHFVDPEKEIGPYVAKLTKRLEKYDCYWMAPPLWKPETQGKFNEWLKDHVAPCKFYDGSHLDLSRRVDHIHPDEKGGKVLAEDFWKFYKGEGAFHETGDAGALLPSPASSAH